MTPPLFIAIIKLTNHAFYVLIQIVEINAG